MKTKDERQRALDIASQKMELICGQYASGLLTANEVKQAIDDIHLPNIDGLLDTNTGLRYPE